MAKSFFVLVVGLLLIMAAFSYLFNEESGNIGSTGEFVRSYEKWCRTDRDCERAVRNKVLPSGKTVCINSICQNSGEFCREYQD